MINAAALLKDLKRLTTDLEADIRNRLDEEPQLKDALVQEWQAARDAKRTAQKLHDFLEEHITQAAVHWLLMGVFIRFLEDNGLVERPYLSGATHEARALARDRHEGYFRANPTHSDRDYLEACFREVSRLPGMAALFDERHNPLWRLPVSGDGGMRILAFWQRVNPDTGELVHDFTDPDWSTRFLGDLYQDLSEAAKKRFALLQTPEFVEEFILDRTLEPAVREFGYREVRLIDPTCGSGHFLLGAFHRLLAHWRQNEPTRNPTDLAQRALNGVYGVDLNPFAVAVAHFRLLIAALQASETRRLANAHNFRIHLAAGDSLLHGPRLGFGHLELGGDAELLAESGVVHAFEAEDLAALNEILGQRYHAVVGNPPYITVKDAALNAFYRERYASCHMKYSLGVPFTERFFELALGGDNNNSAGYVGMITANSFMKREFGKKLIEQFLPRVDLTHVINTDGVYIPGHGTPTVILFGRNREPVAGEVRTVMGINGEPSTPANPAQGLVWQAILAQVDRPGSESKFVSVADTVRTTLAQHPWSLGGGGAAELKVLIEDQVPALSTVISLAGIFGMTNADEAMLASHSAFRRRGVEDRVLRSLIMGDAVRDWSADTDETVFFPYEGARLHDIGSLPGAHRWMWPVRTVLGNRATFGKQTYFLEGRPWWEWHQLSLDRLKEALSLSFGEVATHNHFVLDRGGKVFNRTAPVIKLPPGASEDDHLALLGLLNSSVACFWLKQVCFPKGGDHVGTEGARVRKTAWDERYAFNAGNVAAFPVVEPAPSDLARKLDQLAQARLDTMPGMLLQQQVPSRAELDAARNRALALRNQMIAAQEELDWDCYRRYGLIERDLTHPNPPELRFGERAFEIVFARRMAAGDEESSWFERHGASPIIELPSHWPQDYREVVEQRIALIESDRSIGLIERPEYKRRWAQEAWQDQEQAALRDWLLDRLEQPRYWAEPQALTSTNKLADLARQDAEFMQVAELYSGRSDFDVAALVAALVESEAVPLLPVLRYKEAGLRKRVAWEETWALQRQEDAIDAEVAAELQQADDESDEDFAARLAAAQRQRKQEQVGDIPVPPKYKSTDFINTTFWRLRGGLDVPKERFVSFPHCSRDADGSLVVAWAGWDHLQLAQAVAAYYLDMKDNEGWSVERLVPLLAGLQELVPWLKQWHNELNPDFGERMGDYFASFVEEEARALGTTVPALGEWRPPVVARRRGRKAKADA